MKKGVVFFIIFGAIILWIYLFNQSQRLDEKPLPLELTLASLIYIISIIPTVIYFFRKEENLPFLPAFSIVYFIYFGLGVFTRYHLIQSAYIEHEVLIKVLNLSLLGIFVFLVSFYSPFYQLFKPLCPRLDISWNPQAVYKLALYTGISGLFFFYLNDTFSIIILSQGTTAFLTELTRFSIAIFYLLILQKQIAGRGKLIFLIIFILRLMQDLGTGSTSLVVVDLSIILFLYIYYHKKVPFNHILFSLVFFVLIFGVRDEFRKQVWYSGEYSRSNFFAKAGVYFRLIFEDLLHHKEREGKKYEEYEKVLQRADALITFSKVVTLTPEIIPYWNGYTYRYLYTSLVPRFLYPAKPMKILGQEFGHRYELLDPYDYTTSYNLPVLVEFYVNFGSLGIIVGMFILGFFFRILYQIFNYTHSGEGGIIIATVLLTVYYNLESDLSLLFGNFIHYVFLLYLLLKFNLVSTKRIL
ncbi:MAG: hypothetical protein NC826_04795 [Candidatus Omnitrophica bacterium]|nr:hypothetical protein [Candidatus Omnitrophota bacterium]